jgi:hypothetical protein
VPAGWCPQPTPSAGPRPRWTALSLRRWTKATHAAPSTQAARTCPSRLRQSPSTLAAPTCPSRLGWTGHFANVVWLEELAEERTETNRWETVVLFDLRSLCPLECSWVVFRLGARLSLVRHHYTQIGYSWSYFATCTGTFFGGCAWDLFVVIHG